MIYLKLTKPFDPGSYDAGNTYPHVLVTSFNFAVLDMVIEIRYAYGTFDAQKGFVPGAGSIPQVAHVQGNDFIEAIQAMPEAGQNDSVLMAAARECYNFLAKSGAAKGEVVEGTVQPAADAEDSAPAAATDDTAATPAADAATAG